MNRIDTGQSNRGELLSLIDQLNEMTPGGTADFESALEAYAERIRSRSLVVVFSDCLADPEALESGIAALARNDADVLLVRVVAPAERDPGVVGDVLFADPESDETRRSYFSGSLAETYQSRLDAHIDSVSNRVTALGADHVLINTGEDYFDSFASIWLQ